LDYGADVKGCAHCDDPPLILAEEWGDIETVRLFLDHGADVNVQSRAGMTSLQMAVGTGDPRLVQLLIDRGVKVPTGYNYLADARGLVQRNPEYTELYNEIITMLNKASKAQGY
jgi:ankyrin repeat protein